MEKIIEVLEPYIILQNLCGNQYKLHTHVFVGETKPELLQVTRDIRIPSFSELFIEVRTFSKDFQLELRLDFKSEKKRISNLNEVVKTYKNPSWKATRYFVDKKYELSFPKEEELIDFLQKYVLKG